VWPVTRCLLDVCSTDQTGGLFSIHLKQFKTSQEFLERERDMLELIQNLWKRRVFQFGALYLGVAWLLLQVAVVLEEMLSLPNWLDQSVLVLLIIGFPLSLILAWAQDTKANTSSSDMNLPAATSDTSKSKRQANKKPSIAVLPFLNMSEDRNNEHFADGMTEDILTTLSLSQHLSVASRTSSFKYKGRADDVRTIGQTLDVDYVVEGSIRPMGKRIRITAQLINTQTGAHVWAEKYDRPLDALFEIQDEVLGNIVSSLNLSLTFGAGNRLLAAKPESLTNWERVQRANAMVSRGSLSDFSEVVSELEKAVAEEPGYAYAASMLSWAYLIRINNGGNSDRLADIQRALLLMEKGLLLAPSDPLNLYYCASSAGYSGQYDRAIELAEASLKINPSQVEAYAPIAQANTNLGNFEKAEAALKLFGSSASVWILGTTWYKAILRSAELRYEEAMPLIKLTVQGAPEYILPRLHLAVAQEALGDRPDALDTIKRAYKISPELDFRAVKTNFRSYVYPKAGEAERRINLLIELWQDASAGSEVKSDSKNKRDQKSQGQIQIR
jgi:TolB-like protein